MGYFNYHAKLKNLIKSGHCTHAIFKQNYNGISPALVLYFDNNRPMPVRIFRFEEYIKILNEENIECQTELNNANLFKTK